jgi:hypothetical protein
VVGFITRRFSFLETWLFVPRSLIDCCARIPPLF